MGIPYLIRSFFFPKSVYLKNMNKVDYFIHITDRIEDILKEGKINLSTNRLGNHSNRGIPALYGYYKIPNKLILPRDKELEAIKIKLNDDLKKNLKIRKFDRTIFISYEDINKYYIDLRDYDYEIISIKN